MSRPADASLHEPDSGTCGISPTHNDCRKAEPGGSAAQRRRPRRSTNRPACERRQPYGPRHRTARVWTRISSTIPFYGWFRTKARISLALACPRINRRGTPMGMGVWARAIWRARPSARPERLRAERESASATTGPFDVGRVTGRPLDEDTQYGIRQSSVSRSSISLDKISH